MWYALLAFVLHCQYSFYKKDILLVLYVPGSRTQRLVNPHAWDKGLVYLQCQDCEVWHKLKDNQSMVEEVRLTESG